MSETVKRLKRRRPKSRRRLAYRVKIFGGSHVLMHAAVMSASISARRYFIYFIER